MIGQFSQNDLKTIPGLERVLRNVYQEIGQRMPAKPGKIDLQTLVKTIAPQIRNELQAFGSAPLDLTDLLPVTSGAQCTMDTHANRLVLFTPPDSAGLLFWETDRTVLYVSLDVGTLVWHFAAGVMTDVIGSRPADLSTRDEGFLFFATDTTIMYIWDGSAWQDISGVLTPAEVEAVGYWSPVTNGDPVNPELIFDSFGDVVVSWTPTP